MPKVIQRKQLRAIGVTCGIGSMLVGARQAGFEVLGNIEWRRYYHLVDEYGRNTFQENFPGAVFTRNISQVSDVDLKKMTGVELAMGHPECGSYSQLNRDKSLLKSPSDIPIFVDLIARLRPSFFVMDDLPASLGAFPICEYHARLPDYDLFPEWVSNWGYGNVQKQRNRMFMIGSLRDWGWSFVPGEARHDRTVADVLQGLPPENNDEQDLEAACASGSDVLGYGTRMTWGEMQEFVLENLREGESLKYIDKRGNTSTRIGVYRGHWNGPAHVLTKGLSAIHPLRGTALNLRERARIQGFPDDFVFYGTKLDDDGRWNHDANVDMTRQTGKAMPIQFNRYVADQVRGEILGVSTKLSGGRILKPNPHVDEAKRWYCTNVGYSNQNRACSDCWVKDRCEIRSRSTPGVTIKESLEAKNGVEPMKKTARTTVKKRPSDPAAPTPAKTSRRSRPTVEIRRVETKVVEFRDKTRTSEVRVGKVNVFQGDIPADYHCRCRFCTDAIGELRPEDGSYYSRLERRGYYDKIESGKKGHVAKTPLHLARWAIQQYSEPGDWVLDPTAGAGTTVVESLVQGRNAAGMELQFDEILSANARRHAVGKVQAVIGFGDARNIAGFLRSLKRTYPLVINNPPYSGDEQTQNTGGPNPLATYDYTYDRALPNLAFLKEGDEYWRTMAEIYAGCVQFLRPGGRFVVGVKDQMRRKRPDQLHERFAELLESIGLEHEGTAFLRHHPGTLHLHTYGKRYGIQPPLYQSIVVFRRPG